MKKIFLTGVAVVAVLLFSDMYAPNENKVEVQTSDTKLPDWQWSSGEVAMHKTATEQSFSLVFNPSIYHAGDSAKVTFTSYKVSITGLNPGTTYKKWTGKTSLDYNAYNEWIPLAIDRKHPLNRLFSGVNNVASDSVTNISVWAPIPANHILVITASALSFEMDTAEGHGAPISTNGAPTFTTSIRGIEVEKSGKK